MRTKRLIVILSSCIFAVAILTSCLFIFTISKIDVKFTAEKGSQTMHLQQDLEQFSGKNLIFLKNEKVDEVISKYPYFKLDSVSKGYPNVLELEISQRIPVYRFIDQNKNVYLLDKTGFVVDCITEEQYKNLSLLTIELTFATDSSANLTVGKPLNATDKDLFDSVLSMCDSIDLTDCVNKIYVNDNPEFRDVDFYTNSGVKIQITSAYSRANEKISKAIQSYHNAKDYYKTFDTITVFVLKSDGSIQCQWTNWNKGE